MLRHCCTAAGTKGSNTSGIPWEACVKLSNSAQKDMWINIPGHADDEFSDFDIDFDHFSHPFQRYTTLRGTRVGS